MITCRKRIKSKILQVLGNKCSKCGYNKCEKALEAHHLDSHEKKFKIADASSRSWEDIEKELTKCILLCANCHREIHS
jgi:hypothetical protein